MSDERNKIMIPDWVCAGDFVKTDLPTTILPIELDEEELVKCIVKENCITLDDKTWIHIEFNMPVSIPVLVGVGKIDIQASKVDQYVYSSLYTYKQRNFSVDPLFDTSLKAHLNNKYL
jgi:hypothetical protein